MTFAAVDRLLELGELDEARRALDGGRPGSPATAWGHAVRRHWLALVQSDGTVDEHLLALEDRLHDRPTDLAVDDIRRAYGLVARAWVWKRCPTLAQAVEDRAEAELGPDPAIELWRAQRCLAFDDRTAADEHLTRAAQWAPGRADVTYARANLAYIEGAFVEAHGLLDAVDPKASCRRSALRLRASVYAATHDYANEAEAWRTLLDEADHPATGDRLSHALALAANDDLVAASQQLRLVWRADPDGDHGRYARQRLEILEAADPKARRHRLTAFPSTYQKRNYCGPAVLELCLRYLNFDLGADEIAQTVREGEGTPMFAIVDYLAAHGIEARRIEATPARIRAALDLGLPVIVQEEYSTTSHVAVITGYDARLGVFLASDPATHRPLIKTFRWLESAGDLFGNGGVIVLGRSGPATAALANEADDADLTDAEHLRLLDDCDRRRPRPGQEASESLAPEEIVRLCDRAIEREHNFKLAWYRRAWAQLRWWHEWHGDAQRERAVLSTLLQIRSRFPWDEWPHQIHAAYLRDHDRHEEAFVAYFEAWQRDRGDANNLANMGVCKWHAGDLAAAERHLLRSLAGDPTHAGAARALSAVYLRQLEALDEDEELDPTADPLAHATVGDPAQARTAIDRDAATLLRLARHHATVACARAPTDPRAHAVLGSAAARSGDHHAAAEAFETAARLDPDLAWAQIGRAAACEHAGDLDQAESILEDTAGRLWGHLGALLSWANLLVRRGRSERAAEVLEAGIERGPDDREAVAKRFFAITAKASSREAAATRLREIAQSTQGDPGFVRDCAWLLDREDQRGHAIALFRHVVAGSPGDVAAVFQLGSLLADSLSTRTEGISLLRHAIELSPEHPAPRRRLAALLADLDPEAGLEILAPTLGGEDPYVFGVQADLLARLGRDADADDALQHALACGGDPIETRVDLIYWHLRRNQYDRAYALARDLTREHPDPEVQTWARDAWISAHRLAGRQREILEDVRALCEDGVDPGLGFEVYFSFRTVDRRLAAAGADAAAEHYGAKAGLQWTIRAIGALARAGEPKRLDDAPQLAGDDAEAWAQLVYVYDDLDRTEEAAAAAARAHELDPTARDVLSAMEHIEGKLGHHDKQLELARRLLELHPYEHQGPERLGWLLAKKGDVEPALTYSQQAVDAAPYCHLAHTSRAVALMMAGNLDEALAHAQQAEVLEPSAEDEQGADRLLVLHALRGDKAAFAHSMAEHEKDEPAGSFPAFEQRLRELLAERE